MSTIAVFVGSLHEKSLNKRVAKTLESFAPDDMTFRYVDINMPLFNQDLEADYPQSAQAGKDIVEAADGVLFVTPEYNRSIPGALKNAIDWISRPYGFNTFAHKPVGIVGVSGGPVGTAVMQAEMRHVLSYLDMKQMNQPEMYLANISDAMFDADGMLIEERWQKNLKAYMDAFVEWIK